jgi:DNA-binding NtrC family response regulator
MPALANGPQSAPSQLSPPTEAVARKQNQSVERKTAIVILDDEPTVSRVAAKFLRDALHDSVEIFFTTDWAQARRLIGESKCDILLTDIEMPGADGLEILRFARKCNAWTRVILMTGHSTWDRLAEAIEGGASDYLLKPFDSQELVQVVMQEHERLQRWNKTIRYSLTHSDDEK